MLVLIVLNAIFIWVDLDSNMNEGALRAINLFFLIIFTLEIVLKLFAFGSLC